MDDDLKWEFYLDAAGEHRWRAKDAHNGEVLFVSAEGYVDKRDAEHCAVRAGWHGLKDEGDDF